MAWTQADVDALKAAMATGALSVNYAGPPARSITYRSLDEMNAVLALMQREVSGANAVPYRLVSTKKGV